MAGYSEEDIRKVKESSDFLAIVAETTPVKQKGRDFWCCCPFHEEKSPSCKIDPASQLWHCFGCGEGGDIVSFVMKRDGLEFVEALELLAEKAHIELTKSQGPQGVSRDKKQRLKSVCLEAARFYHRELTKNPSERPAQARAYLAARSFNLEVATRWMLGYAPGKTALSSYLKNKGYTQQEIIDANLGFLDKRGILRDRFFDRVMFPIFDIKGECIAFGGRVLGQGEPKYLNSRETPIFHKSEVLFALDQAKASMVATGTAIICEGYTDVIALHEAGQRNVVATLGTALTRQHIRILARQAQHKIIYLFDGDEAGQRAAERALSFIDYQSTPEAGRNKLELFAVTLPDKLDPADFIEKRGLSELQKLLDQALPLIEYGIQRKLSLYNLNSAEDRMRAAHAALQILAPIKSSLLAKDYAVRIAGLVRMREEDLLSELEHLQPGDDQVHEVAQDAVQAPAPRTLELSAQDKIRLDTELQVLAGIAYSRSCLERFMGELAQIRWSSKLSSDIFAQLFDLLAQNPEMDNSVLISLLCQSSPVFAQAVSKADFSDEAALCTKLDFLIEDLSLRDLEDSIAELQAELKHSHSLNEEDAKLLYQTIVALQQDLRARKLRHQIHEA